MVILRKLCSRTLNFERSEFFQSFNDFSEKNHLEPSWEPILRVPEQKFWKSAPLKFLFRKYSKKWTGNDFFCRNIKILLHCIIIFIFGTVVAFSTQILGTGISVNFCSAKITIFYIGIDFIRALKKYSEKLEVPTPM